MTHPLTDEICEQIADTLYHPFTLIERENMRAAADWQLEQVIEWLKEYPMRAGRARMIADFKQAMRPQEDR